ncbi:MAG: 50S ribosomal protein L25, partial [Cyclobacteriaceae bacterium]|nr:50S ribosomal protein L25 [Cyclobacteriaceae bacterium]
MKTIEIIGYKRANLGKAESKRLRAEANVPCVLYGGDKQIHFHAPMILFRELIYTRDAHFVHLNIEGEEYQAIIQDVQYHPVSEVILHADFLQLFEGKKIKMDIPVKLVGQSPAVQQGGTLVHKRRTLSVLALPKNMPSHIDVDISNLNFHHSV